MKKLSSLPTNKVQVTLKRFREMNIVRGGGERRDSCGKRVLGETPEGIMPEEAQRAPAESELFPAAPNLL
ncbi:hypothetical protein HLI_16150 [Halobacillus litoralis]|uniref:Uncharacterized protein n=1 Tax=Halobacillus litoralis TaxID=45668 RepID=A0A410MFZ5_9BACI|nr:hypothetical protein HLI_16150 [Halobacillus litoralis]